MVVEVDEMPVGFEEEDVVCKEMVDGDIIDGLDIMPEPVEDDIATGSVVDEMMLAEVFGILLLDVAAWGVVTGFSLEGVLD